MPSREETRQQSRGLREALLRDCGEGSLRPGDALPTVRELAARHGMSVTSAQRVLRALADEGVLQLRQGSGAFVARLPGQEDRAFASVFAADPATSSFSLLFRTGFEGELSRRSAASLCLHPQTPGLAATLEKISRRELKLAGVFYFPSLREDHEREGRRLLTAMGQVPVVVYEEHRLSHCTGWPEAAFDLVCFDHEEGSRLAVRHLMGRGHEGIGFVALHQEQLLERKFYWSRSRAEGFTKETARLALRGQIFEPDAVPAGFSVEDQEQAGFEASLKLLPLVSNGLITAVVCVNQYALEGLLHALYRGGIPESSWPTIMAFDDESQDSHLLSVVRLPWDEMGRVAAGVLWKRAFGTAAERDAPPQDILVPMQLVQRVAIADHFDTSRLRAAAIHSRVRSVHAVSAL